MEKISIANLHNILQDIKVYQTDGISSELHLSQEGKLRVHILGSSDFHTDENGPCAEIFVPRNKKRRDRCYVSKLPSKLFDWLMTDPLTSISNGAGNERGWRLVGVILSCPKSLIPEVLEEEGIVAAGLEMDVEEDVSDDESLASGTLVVSLEGGTPRSPTSFESATGQRYNPSSAVRHSLRPSRSPHNVYEISPVIRPTGGSNAHREVAASPATADADTDTYKQLLEKVVVAARRAGFPTVPTGPLDNMEALRASLDMISESSYPDTGAAVRFRSKTQLERDRMVGAAGELYVSTIDSSRITVALFFRTDLQSDL